jgi:cytochrome c556
MHRTPAVRKRPLWLAPVALAVVFYGLMSTGATSAQKVSPADVIEARQKGFKSLGAASKLIRDELRETPDPAKIKTAAVDIQKAAAEIGAWFPAGTGPEAGVKTAAKAEIWSDSQGFASAQDNFVTEARRYAQLAEAGDIAALSEATKALGQTCKGCHDKYRVKKPE